MKSTIAIASFALSLIAFSAAAQKTQDSTSQHNTAAPAESATPVAPPPGRVCPVFVISFPPHKVFQEEEKRLICLFPDFKFEKTCVEKYVGEFNRDVEELKKNLKKCLAGGKPPFPTKEEAEQSLQIFQKFYDAHVVSTDFSGCRRPLKR